VYTMRGLGNARDASRIEPNRAMKRERVSKVVGYAARVEDHGSGGVRGFCVFAQLGLTHRLRSPVLVSHCPLERLCGEEPVDESVCVRSRSRLIQSSSGAQTPKPSTAKTPVRSVR
jgi:hypothetical protein